MNRKRIRPGQRKRRLPPDPGLGEQIVRRRGHDPAIPGRTYRFRNISGGGGPGGLYWTVLSSGTSPPNEDLGSFDWTVWTHVRPATDEEAAPVAMRIAAKENRT